MTSADVVILNEPGLHTRPASMLASLAARFASRITLSDGGDPVDAKSIMGVLMLAAITGTTLTVTAAGDDEAHAVASITRLIESKFDDGVLDEEKRRAAERR
jgi:phosphotransferase system HPr (HPr) family protein